MSKKRVPIPHEEYLTARDLRIVVEQALRDKLRSKFLTTEPGKLLVGILWKSEQSADDAGCVLNILEWGPILHVPGMAFVNLQPGDCHSEISAAVKGFNIPIAHSKALDPHKNLANYATRVAAMDIVIGPESEATAIASALGIPTLCIAPLGVNSNDTTSTRQTFAQRQASEWLDVFRDVGLALLDCAARAGVVKKRAPYLRTMAQAFANMNRPKDSEHLYRVMMQEPGLKAEGLHAIAALKQKEGQTDNALNLYGEALLADPTLWQAYNGIGLTLASVNRFDDAITAYRKGLELNPQSGEIHNNLGTSLRRVGRSAEALPHYRQAKALLPNVASIRLNEASALDEIGDTDTALGALDELIAASPDYVAAHYNKSQILLSLGKFDEGWKQSVWRLKRPEANVRHDSFPQPIWNGESMGGKSILVWTEQGIGDELLTISMVPDLINTARQVTVLCSERLVPLVRRSFPNAIVEHRVEPLPAGATSPSIDYQMSLSELGGAFRRTFTDFPKRRHFLTPDQNKRDMLRAKYQVHHPGSLLVGISWMSQKNYEIGWLKSQNLRSWAPILSTPNVTFVNLQYGDRQDELRKVKENLGIEILQDDGVDPLTDMDTFAAQVAAMDLVISASNTTVHTAGALGVPTWMLAAKGRGRIWYWFRGKDESRWYPSVRFINQENEGVWEPVLERCAAELVAWSQEKADSH